MANDDFGTQALGDRLYADAVCAQCSTVNPEGTLICKTCGNNLRDQRTIRLAAEQELGQQDKPVERRKVMLGLLTAFGLLLVLWVSLNVDTITTWLVSTGASGPDPSALWQGNNAATYEQMLSELDGAAPPASEARAILTNFDKGDDINGIYVIAQSTSLGPRPVGSALIRQQDDTIYFAARIGNGTEVRGKAVQQGNSWAANYETTGAAQGDRHFAVAGVALHKPEGWYECFGQSEVSEDGYDFYAYKVPAPAAGSS